MTEERRLVEFSHTRENFDVELMTNDPTCYLVALTADQIEIARKAIQYAHRRINWIDEQVNDLSYYLPDDETWDIVEATVDDMEDRLMDGCSLQELVDAISGLCSCLNAQAQMQSGTISQILLMDAISTGTVVFEEPVLTPLVDEDACDAAQVLWYMIYEYVSEIAIPLANATFELIVPGALAYLAMIGGVTPFLIMFGLTVEAVQEMLEAGMNSNGQATLNWLLAAKKELICAIYNGMLADPCDLSEVYVLVDAGDAPALTKVFLKLAFQWLAPSAQLVRDSDWSVARKEASYCTDCEPLTGCLDFNDPAWTIDENYGTLDEETGVLTVSSPNSGYVAAYETIALSQANVRVLLNPPDLYPPAFYAVTVRVEDVGLNVENWSVECSENGIQWQEHEFAMEDPVTLYIVTVAGTTTQVLQVCTEEAT